jgi:hypothetical protein
MPVDLRVPNASTKPTAWPMPNLQDELQDLHGSEVFATLDFCQGYWQIPLHKGSQDCQSFITLDGVYTPTRVLHGARNATQHLQSMLVVMMDDISSNIKVWLDECLLFCRPDQCSRSSNVGDDSCLLVSSLPPLFYTMTSRRDIHIYKMLKNDYTVPTRCRHRSGMVDPLGYKACRAVRQPISHQIKYLITRSKNIPN